MFPRRGGGRSRWVPLALAVALVLIIPVTLLPAAVLGQTPGTSPDAGASLPLASPLPSEPAATPAGSPRVRALAPFEVLGFLPSWMYSLGSHQVIAATDASIDLSRLTTLAWFGVGADKYGHLVTTGNDAQGWTGWNSAAFASLKERAQAAGVRVVLTIQRFAWNPVEARQTVALLSNPARRTALAQAITTAVTDAGADGVNLDFEPLPSAVRDDFTAFVRELRLDLDAAAPGMQITFDVTSGIVDYDIPALVADDAADAVMIMGYDYIGNSAARGRLPRPARRTQRPRPARVGGPDAGADQPRPGHPRPALVRPSLERRQHRAARRDAGWLTRARPGAAVLLRRRSPGAAVRPQLRPRGSLGMDDLRAHRARLRDLQAGLPAALVRRCRCLRGQGRPGHRLGSARHRHLGAGLQRRVPGAVDGAGAAAGRHRRHQGPERHGDARCGQHPRQARRPAAGRRPGAAGPDREGRPGWQRRGLRAPLQRRRHQAPMARSSAARTTRSVDGVLVVAAHRPSGAAAAEEATRDAHAQPRSIRQPDAHARAPPPLPTRRPGAAPSPCSGATWPATGRCPSSCPSGTGRGSSPRRHRHHHRPPRPPRRVRPRPPPRSHTARPERLASPNTRTRQGVNRCVDRC